MAEVTVSPQLLAARAAYILRGNDIGELTTAAPHLYPHLWSWDAALVAIGLATVSVPRAIAELQTLLRGQWRTGMLPHILFGPDEDYFPGADVWDSACAPAAPVGVRTSGICQPPVHAIAVRRVLDAGRRNGGEDRELAERFARNTFDRWLAWHRWLAYARDPARRGILEIYHSWESGMDNSPRWDAAYASVVPRVQLSTRSRRDLQHIADATQRPTDAEYRRYLWLVHQMREARYDNDQVRETVDFRMADVFMSAVAAVAAEELAEMGEEFGRDEEAAELCTLGARFRTGVLSTVSEETGLARDQDMRSGSWLDVQSIAGFAPLLCGGDTAVLDRQVALLSGPAWCGHPALRYAVPPTTSPQSPAFAPRAYWRGPQWPVMSWLLSWGLARQGCGSALAEQIRGEGLRQMADLSFGEYFEPLTGEALGSTHQSWSAAIALDWLMRPSFTTIEPVGTMATVT